MYKGIDPDYYGYRDEDDGVLVLCEMEGQEKGRGLVRAFFLCVC